MKITGAELILNSLKSLGIKQIFSYNHKSLDPLFEDPKLAKGLEITFAIKPENTSYMAMGYARSKGEPAAVIVPLGTSAAQIIPGLISAYLDSIPMICITGQVHSAVLGTDAFQETDTLGMTQSCTKHNYLVNHLKDLPRILSEAYFIATTGRPGPVLLNLPIDFLEQLTETPNAPFEVKLKGYKPVEKGHAGQIKKAVDFILQSEKPILYCGGGVLSSKVEGELLHFAESLHVPVAQTLTGISSFPGDHPLNLGLVGNGGEEFSNITANSADLVIAIGTRFNPHVIGKVDGFKVLSKVIHIDIDPSSIAKNTRVDVPIVGDAKEVLKQILDLAKDQKNEVKKFKEKLIPWLEQIKVWRTQYLKSTDDKTLNLESAIKTIDKTTQHKAYLCTSHPKLLLAAAKNYIFLNPRQWCPTGGIEVPGFAVSASIGVLKACPAEPVFGLTTFGNLLKNLSELVLVQSEKLPLKLILFCGPSDTLYLKQIDLEYFCKTFGLTYLICDQIKTLESALKKSLTQKKSHLICVKIPEIL